RTNCLSECPPQPDSSDSSPLRRRSKERSDGQFGQFSKRLPLQTDLPEGLGGQFGQVGQTGASWLPFARWRRGVSKPAFMACTVAVVAGPQVSWEPAGFTTSPSR